MAFCAVLYSIAINCQICQQLAFYNIYDISSPPPQPIICGIISLNVI